MSTLSFAEDLRLLLLDESSGVLYRLPRRTLDFGLATAALLELNRGNRIDTDTDPDCHYLVDAAPLGDPVTDPDARTYEPEDLWSDISMSLP